MSGLMPKFIDDKEAQKVSVAVNWQGEALMSYLARAKERAVQALLVARGEDIVRLQGAVMFADELITKFCESRGTADKLVKGKQRA